MTKIKSVAIQISAGVLAVILATAGVEYGAIELGALIYFIIPIVVTVGSVILFFLLDASISTNRVLLTTIFTIIILLTGLLMRLDFYYKIIDL